MKDKLYNYKNKLFEYKENKFINTILLNNIYI